MSIEFWNPVDDHPSYYVSTLGRVMNKFGHVMKAQHTGAGYRCITIRPAKVLVHRLVAQAFIDNPDNKACVNHKNGDKSDNRVDNLEWVTASENMLHSYRSVHRKRATKAVNMLSDSKEIIKTYNSMTEAARDLGISVSSITTSISRKCRAAGHYWERVDKEIQDEERYPIPDIPHYEITKTGKLYSVRKNKWMKLQDCNSYLFACLKINGIATNKCIHVLVAQTFIPNPDKKPQVNHKDGNKLNNHVSNLEWVTQSENIQHRYDMIRSDNQPAINAQRY